MGGSLARNAPGRTRNAMDEWIDYYDSTHTIYVSKLHRELHFKLIARDIISHIDRPDAVVLDYACGEALSSRMVADACGTLILADTAHLPRLLTLLTWEQYNRSLRDDAVLPGIAEWLGGPYFAVLISDARLGMEFDGDGTYTIPESSVRASDS